MSSREFNQQWDAAADGVARSLIEGMARPGERVRRGWRWKTIRSFVVGRTRVTLSRRRHVI
jgi:hypothetical protein